MMRFLGKQWPCQACNADWFGGRVVASLARILHRAPPMMQTVLTCKLLSKHKANVKKTMGGNGHNNEGGIIYKAPMLKCGKNGTCISWKSFPACISISNKACKYRCNKYLLSQFLLVCNNCSTTSYGGMILRCWISRWTVLLLSTIIRLTTCRILKKVFQWRIWKAFFLNHIVLAAKLDSSILVPYHKWHHASCISQ